MEINAFTPLLRALYATIDRLELSRRESNYICIVYKYCIDVRKSLDIVCCVLCIACCILCRVLAWDKNGAYSMRTHAGETKEEGLMGQRASQVKHAYKIKRGKSRCVVTGAGKTTHIHIVFMHVYT